MSIFIFTYYLFSNPKTHGVCRVRLRPRPVDETGRITKCRGQNFPLLQSGENFGHLKRGCEATSSPSAPARKRQVSTETCRFQLYSPYGELYAPSVRDICFASDMPAGVRGEYNITLLQYLAYGEVCKAYHILRSKIYHSV